MLTSPVVPVFTVQYVQLGAWHGAEGPFFAVRSVLGLPFILPSFFFFLSIFFRCASHVTTMGRNCRQCDEVVSVFNGQGRDEWFICSLDFICQQSEASFFVSSQFHQTFHWKVIMCVAGIERLEWHFMCWWSGKEFSPEVCWPDRSLLIVWWLGWFPALTWIFSSEKREKTHSSTWRNVRAATSQTDPPVNFLLKFLNFPFSPPEKN